VNEEVVSQHTEEAAFLWTLRTRAIGEPHYSLDDLATLDERVEAHLNGLRVAGDAGWRFCKASLAVRGPGEVFALAALAFEAGDRERMREALHEGCSWPEGRRGLVSALGWLEYPVVSRWITMLLAARTPVHREIGIAASAVHRRDPGAALGLAANDDDPSLRARALRAIGELKTHELDSVIRHHLRDADGVCRFWAAWSATLLGRREGIGILTNIVQTNQPFSAPALNASMRALGLESGRRFISDLARQPDLARLTVMGSGILGDPFSIPWLLQIMESPELARLAGEAFTLITGVDLARDDLEQDAPPMSAKEGDEASIDEVLALDYESNLPWPSPRLIKRWWDAHQDAFVPGVRYLCGAPITAKSALAVMATGKQRQRIAAAMELALLDHRRPLFETRGRAAFQRREVAAWTS